MDGFHARQNVNRGIRSIADSSSGPLKARQQPDDRSLRAPDVETAPGAQLDDLILLDIFSGFSPAEPVETIATSHGSPRELAQPNSGERYYVYEVPAGALWTGYQQTADGATHRLIQLHPDSLPLAAVVKPSVLAQLPPVSGSYWIIVYAPGGQLPTARIEVTSDRVNRVLWFGESTTGPTPDSFSRFPG